MTRTWRGRWQQLLSCMQRSRKPSRPAFYRPLLESLEDRLVLSTFLVTNANDSGAGSLRQAIMDSNNTSGPNIIDFDIGGGGVQTISLLSALPTITNPVTIDGTSQPGFAGMPLIVLDGTNAGAGVTGLTITAGNSTVQDLVIDNFTGDGIDLTMQGGNILAGNYIGVDSTGSTAAGNGGHGIAISAGSGNNTIGGTTAAAGNVISANTANGVQIVGGSGNVVQGNLIGTDVSGTLGTDSNGNSLGNGGDGVLISNAATNNTIGGTTTGAGNILSNNSGDGIGIDGSGTQGNLVQGNYIGVDSTGAAALGNGNDGVLVSGGATNNTIGGTTAAARNIISANTVNGVAITRPNPSGNADLNLVQGNYIGTDVSGTQALGNGNDGVRIYGDTQGNIVGGTASGAGNVISANAANGVEISGIFDDVWGNFIGTDATGTLALGNGNDGILIEANNNTIGSTVAGARNIISANAANGVEISGSGTLSTTVQDNYIGTDVTGTQGTDANGNALGNGNDGVFVHDRSGSGNALGVQIAHNVISANSANGVEIYGTNTNRNSVTGNFIGTDVNGTAALGNGGNGVLITTASGNTVGGTASGAGNIIAFSGNDGVKVDTGTSNAIRQNSIHDSSNLGIELVNNGNNNQPAPVLTSAITSGSGITISGTLTAAASTSYVLDFFASPTANPSGFGEGQQFLGSATVTTDASGTASFTASFLASVPAGQAISATATDPANNTSAFAQDVTANAGMVIVPTFDSSITNDPNAAAIESTINSAIQVYESTYSNPVTIQIYFKEMTSGLGRSQWAYYDFASGYQRFRQALAANQAISGQSDQADALAYLPDQTNNPVTNDPDLALKVADVKALGLGYLLGANPGVDQNGHFGGPYDGVVSLNTSITFPPQPNNGSYYSLMAISEHEIDEVLGLGSALPNPPNFGNGPVPFAEDLYRYDGSGNRSFTTNSSALAYFSLDGTTQLAQFDNQNDGGDFGDWQSNPRPVGVPPQVQDAFQTLGAMPSLGVELTALDVLGYDRIDSGASTAPAVVESFPAALAAVAPPSHVLPATATEARRPPSVFVQDATASVLAAPAQWAAGPMVDDAAVTQDNLFVLLGSAGQSTIPLREGPPSNPDMPARPIVPAWALLAPRAGGSEPSASQGLDWFLAAALGDDWPDLPAKD